MLVRFWSKFFKLGFSSSWTENLKMYKLSLEKAEEPELKLSTLTGLWRKQGDSENHLLLLFWLHLSLWLCKLQKTVENS